MTTIRERWKEDTVEEEQRLRKEKDKIYNIIKSLNDYINNSNHNGCYGIDVARKMIKSYFVRVNKINLQLNKVIPYLKLNSKNGFKYYCKNCNHEVFNNFCDRCGAKLDWEKAISYDNKTIKIKTKGGSKIMRLRGFETVIGAPRDTKLPVRGTERAAGYDFYAPEDIIIPAGGCTGNIFLNVKAYMQPNEVLILKIRSSLAVKERIMLETSGVIDSDYYGNTVNDGNISVKFVDNDKTRKIPFVIKKGERCCQGLFFQYLAVDNDISLGTRSGGFGSSGK